MLSVEQVVFRLTQVFFSDPACPLLVCLLVDEVFELAVHVVHLLLELTVSTSDAVDLLLEHLTLVGLLLDVALHFVYLLLALTDLLLDVVHFLCKIIHSTLL